MANKRELANRGRQRIKNVPVKSGAIYKQGDFLYQTATGADGPPAVGNDYDTTTNKILGRVCHDSVGSDGVAYAFAQVVVAETGTQFKIPLYHTTPATAVPTAAMQMPGTFYALRQSAGGFPQVNLTNTTSQHCRVEEPDPADTPTYPTSYTGAAQFANVWVEFNRTATAAPGAI